MSIKLTMYSADLSSELSLPFADQGVRAGFPSPAQDYMTDSIDLNRELIRHPATTFYARASGDSMKDFLPLYNSKCLAEPSVIYTQFNGICVDKPRTCCAYEPVGTILAWSLFARLLTISSVVGIIIPRPSSSSICG